MMRRYFVVLIGIFVSVSLNAQQSSSFSAYKFVRFLQYVAGEYVDTVNPNRLVDDAIVNILEQLDPHSIYISKEDVKAMNEPLEGNFDGIGVEFNILNDTLMVVNPIPGGPSQRVGILAGDRIVQIDGKSVTNIGLKTTDVHKYLRGPKGTKVNIRIKRKGFAELIEFNIIRDKIPIFSIDAAYLINEKIGYIKINRFAATTTQEFTDALRKLKARKMKDLIIDLRGNGGGMLNSAVEIADHFLDQNKLIVYTQGRNSPRTDFYATPEGELPKGRIVVLVDEGSASASEILAGALQDWDRAIIIGRRTFGKGLVQNQMALPDGSMIRLTVARYHTPTGRVIQRPYNNGNMEKYYKELNERYDKGELFHLDSIKLPDSLKYKTLIKGKTVYGGGGILPDIFVSLDTSFYSNYYGRLVRSGFLYPFVLSWVDARRESLTKQFTNFDKFNKKFEVTDLMIEEVITAAEKQNIKRDPAGLATSLNELKKQLKGLVAQSLFSSSEYFEVVNSDNTVLLKALEIFNNWDKYKVQVAE